MPEALSPPAPRFGRALGLAFLVSCPGSFLHGIDSFDFLASVTTARSAALSGALGSERGTLEGLWNNPAGLARMSNRTSLFLAYRNHQGISTLTGGIGTGFPGGGIGFGASGLAYGATPGDAPFAGEAGRPLATGNLSLTGTAALALGDLLGWKVGLDFGGSVVYALETLDASKIEGLLLSAGFTSGVPLGSRVILEGGCSLRNLPLLLSGGTGLSAPSSVSPSLALRWSPGKSLSGRLLLQCDLRRTENVGVSLATEWTIGGLFHLRGGYRFGSETGLTVGGGVDLGIGGKHRLSFGLSQAIATGDRGTSGFTGKTIIQVGAEFGSGA